MSLLHIEDLSKSFGGISALDNINLTIEAGAIHSIIGPNGAGKTTLFNMITGLYKPSAGRIHLDGDDITTRAPYQRAGLGLARTFQNLQIFFNMSAVENVMVGMHMGCDSRFLPSLLRLPSIVRADRRCWERARELMRYVGLGDYQDSAASEMPYGALKWLEIARALAAEPKLMLLDEPAAGLNPAETKEIDRLIQKIAATGVTIVLVEHDMKLVMEISDHILVLDQGKKLAEGSATEIRNNQSVITAYLGEKK